MMVHVSLTVEATDEGVMFSSKGSVVRDGFPGELESAKIVNGLAG